MKALGRSLTPAPETERKTGMRRLLRPRYLSQEPYLSTMNLRRIDKTALSIRPLHEQGNDREYWASKTPLERLEALEYMRQVMYGYAPLTDRVQRVYTIAKLKESFE
jgi:hypothetical protein